MSHADGAAALGEVVFVAVLDVAHDDEVVQHVGQTVLDRCLGRIVELLAEFHRAVLVENQAVAGSLHRLRLRVPDEAHQHLGGLAVARGIDVVEQRVVGRQNQAEIAVHGVQVGREVQVVDGPVDDAHGVLVDERGERHRRIGARREHAVHQIDHAVATHEAAVNMLLLDAQRHLRVVHHTAELRGHALGKRGQHVHVEQFRQHQVGHIVPRAVLVLQHLAVGVPPGIEGLVGGHDHGGSVETHVAVHGVGIHILVPAGIEAEHGIHHLAVGRAVVALLPQRQLAEVAEREHGVLGIVEAVVLLRAGVVVVGRRETVDQLGPFRHGAVLAENLRHVGSRLDHAVHLLDVTVLAGDVALDDFLAVDPRLADGRGAAVGQDGEVLVRDFVVRHVGGQEVDHRRRGAVLEEQDAFGAVAPLVPRNGPWHVGRVQARHRVVDGCCRGTPHAGAWLDLRVERVGEQFNQIGIVDHRIVEQHLFLRQAQLVVGTHAPGIGLEPLLVRVVVGHKERLRTRLAEHRSLPQVVDQAEHRGVVPVFAQPLVDGVAQPFGLTFEQAVVARLKSERASQHGERHDCAAPDCLHGQPGQFSH